MKKTFSTNIHATTFRATHWTQVGANRSRSKKTIVSGIESSVLAGDEEGEPCFGSWLFSSLFLKLDKNGVFALTIPLLDSLMQLQTSPAAPISFSTKKRFSFALLLFFSSWWIVFIGKAHEGWSSPHTNKHQLHLLLCSKKNQCVEALNTRIYVYVPRIFYQSMYIDINMLFVVCVNLWDSMEYAKRIMLLQYKIQIIGEGGLLPFIRCGPID